MKAAGIILIILCIAALSGVVYCYASSSITVNYTDCIATDPMSQPELMELLKEQLDTDTFTGMKLASDTAFSPAESLLYTWTVRISNRTRIPAKAAEIRIIPLSGDIIQLPPEIWVNPATGEIIHTSGSKETIIQPGKDAEISVTVLTGAKMHHVREAIVSWYLWGIPFSERITIGQSSK